MIFGAESCAIDFQTESVLILNKKLKAKSRILKRVLSKNVSNDAGFPTFSKIRYGDHCFIIPFLWIF